MTEQENILHSSWRIIWLEQENELTRRWCYELYCADMWYENGDNTPCMTYEEWCKESEKLDEPYGVFI